LEDLAAHKHYAVDENVADIAERADVVSAARAEWRREHIELAADGLVSESQLTQPFSGRCANIEVRHRRLIK
jgi:hypothetical protein